ncbi:hypothetical protein ACKA01_08385 [Helcococcus kunzii]|uniref:DUF5067 domain-containing protein n=1 Tax=Helcococcus kunzii ATCC 51366 TaxID=883114 RepID=H3NMP7_9FIRM|nr:hypothetical protein [Helcococcus kunzii]EHR34735.1 hypothetical protein HMPREF9709_00608 [Helcococcus kunzii ATCC 51366]QZO76964.1 hypothetical protein HIF96_02795 [Helcococcus kunzii]
MKKTFILLLTIILTLTACSTNNMDQSIIKEPKYENAIKRAEPGDIYYLDDEISLFKIPGVGTFIYNFKEEKITTSLFLEDLEYDKYSVTPLMSEDKENIVFEQTPQTKEFEEKDPIVYNIKNKTVNTVKKDKIKTIELKPEWDNKIKIEGWELKNIILSPENSNKEYFVFKDVEE